MHIELAGPPATLERLLEAWNAAEGPLDDPNLLAALDPLPDGADPTDHWGDRWGAGESQVVAAGPMRVVVVAMAAWQPPVTGFDHIAAAWPDIQITVTYEEPGLGFAGTTVWADGKRVLDRYWMDGCWRDGMAEAA